MRGSVLCTALNIIFVLSVPVPARAHHAFSSEFNPNKILLINGTISEVSWTNPHVAVRITVKDAAGRSELWTIRGDSPALLERNGWSRRALVVGQPVSVCGYEGKSGQHEMSGEQVALASGVRLPFATTDAKSCLRVDVSRAAGTRTSNSTGSMTNPVGTMGNPIAPMGNPIPPMGNPIGPIGR
jgi:hypothetical protein